VPPTSSEPGFRDRIAASFARQAMMSTLGARLLLVEDGIVEIELPFRPELAQQHGFLHAGAIASVLDSACGYAAYTRMPVDTTVLSIEFKLNLLAPAVGERLIARARVIRAGRTITVTQADGFMRTAEVERHVATLIGTMMCVRDSGLAG